MTSIRAATHRRPSIDKSAPVGHAASEHDVPAVVACLTSAFFEDPVWGAWTFPDRASRGERLSRLMGSWARAAVRHRRVRICERAQAVAVWLPPGVPEMTPGEETAFEALVPELVGPRAQELSELLAQFEEHHPRTEPHYYLSLWGTHRDHAGRGLGSSLIGEDLARIDEERMPAYLESTNPANIPRYETLGFRQVGEFGPRGGPVVTTMWREARSAPPAV